MAGSDEWLLAEGVAEELKRRRSWALRALVLGLLALPQAVGQLACSNDRGKLDALPVALAAILQCLSCASVLLGLVYMGLLLLYPGPPLAAPTRGLGWAAVACLVFTGGSLALQPSFQVVNEAATRMHSSS